MTPSLRIDSHELAIQISANKHVAHLEKAMRPDRVGCTAILVWMLTSLSAAWAQTECETKLAELDRLMAESEGLSEARKNAVKMMRDMGARQCQKGNEAAANPILDAQIHALSASDEAKEGTPTLSKTKLTPAYLKGSWCTWQITEDPSVRRDSARYHFYANGSYHVGQPPSYRLDTSAPAWPHERFLREDYTQLTEMSPDEFRTMVHGMREYVWKRGKC